MHLSSHFLRVLGQWSRFNNHHFAEAPIAWPWQSVFAHYPSDGGVASASPADPDHLVVLTMLARIALS